MPLDPEHLAELKHSYEVLDLPLTASALDIRRAYLRMTKRWHPDLYRTGSPEQAEATEMMKILNEARSSIEAAPLRYYDPRFEVTKVTQPLSRTRPCTTTAEVARQKDVPPRNLHWMEFGFRFFFGAIFGLLVTFRVLLWHPMMETASATIAAVVSVLFFGVIAGVLGDKFWVALFRGFWWWW
jgi:hypothetical protein